MPKPNFLAQAAVCAALLLSGVVARAQVPEKLPTAPAYAIGTFECLGLYLNSPDLGQCKVRFRARGAATWREGLPLWFDERASQYRGSLVYLQPATTYDIELMPAKGQAVTLNGQTRNEKFPVGKTTVVPAGENYDELVITESGTPDAYHLVTVPNNQRAAIDVANTTPSCITVDADYVIVRGLELRNAGKHGVLIERNRHDVVVEDCHVIGWGRVGGAPAYGNEGAHDAAVLGEYNNRNLTVQRNLLEHPRGFTNDWSEGHPAGPEAVTFDHSQGGHVIRYNTIRSSEGHGFMDAIGGNSSSSHVGNINRDSDIYGNIITNVWDDAMQVEGANNNVRIWGNYLNLTTQFIATAPTGDGPMYIFRNVFGKSRWTHEEGSNGGYVIKTGGKAAEDLGRRYVFHNTALANGGGQHVFSGHTDPTAYSRNNFWGVPGMMVSGRTPDRFSNGRKSRCRFLTFALT